MRSYNDSVKGGCNNHPYFLFIGGYMKHYLQTNVRCVRGEDEENLEVLTAVDLDQFVNKTLDLVNNVLEEKDNILEENVKKLYK